MITVLQVYGAFMAIAFLGFGLEIANRIYKDENVEWSMTFYIIFLSYILDNHIANGYLHWVFVVTLTFLCFINIIYTFSKKQPKN